MYHVATVIDQSSVQHHAQFGNERICDLCFCVIYVRTHYWKSVKNTPPQVLSHMKSQAELGVHWHAAMPCMPKTASQVIKRVPRIQLHAKTETFRL